MAEIRYDALAFTGAETRAMLECHGVEASKPATKTLVDRTEGWAAGIRLAAIALQQKGGPVHADEIEARLGPDHSLVADYLVAEVLQGMPTRDREFLLSTSVVGEISPGLANELTGRRDSERMLIDLSRRNTFVQPVPGSPGRYRTHSLFREFLRAQLALEAPASVADLASTRSPLVRGAEDVAEAVDHSVAAGDWVEAAKLVVGRNGDRDSSRANAHRDRNGAVSVPNTGQCRLG